jgi:hypothetical protein
MQLDFEAEIWQHSESSGGWHFVTLPQELANEIHILSQGHRGNWGTLKVLAHIGTTEWKTSIFRDSKRNSYLLPIKSVIRKAESLQEGQSIRVILEAEIGLASKADRDG